MQIILKYRHQCRLVDYNAALATICFMLFLGFADDVLDIPWRVKLALPCIASLPLIIAYSGGTSIVLPRPLRLGPLAALKILHLGPLYYLYMVAVVIFCTNSINILAGVNGLEVGQTVVIASAVLSHNLLQLGNEAVTQEGALRTAWDSGSEAALGLRFLRVPGGWTIKHELSGLKPRPPFSHSFPVREGHLFSAYLMLPLIFTSAGLLLFNWYPSQVGGDGVCAQMSYVLSQECSVVL